MLKSWTNLGYILHNNGTSPGRAPASHNAVIRIFRMSTGQQSTERFRSLIKMVKIVSGTSYRPLTLHLFEFLLIGGAEKARNIFYPLDPSRR